MKYTSFSFRKHFIWCFWLSVRFLLVIFCVRFTSTKIQLNWFLCLLSMSIQTISANKNNTHHKRQKWHTHHMFIQKKQRFWKKPSNGITIYILYTIVVNVSFEKRIWNIAKINDGHHNCSQFSEYLLKKPLIAIEQQNSQ